MDNKTITLHDYGLKELICIMRWAKLIVYIFNLYCIYIYIYIYIYFILEKNYYLTNGNFPELGFGLMEVITKNKGLLYRICKITKGSANKNEKISCKQIDQLGKSNSSGIFGGLLTIYR